MMERSELAPKVTATYQAVIDLLMEGVDVGSLTVSEITGRAGIGKGTATVDGKVVCEGEIMFSIG